MNKEIQVLDNGFVKLINYMGDDDAIANAARVSYAAGTKTKRDNEQLVRFLMRHQHYSPFGQCQVQFHLRLPIYVHNQFVRHDRFVWNMMSGRYSVMPDEKWTPSAEDVRGQGSDNKQVGNGELDENSSGVLSSMVKDYNRQSNSTYATLLKEGICREQARTVLPMGQYTEGVVTANLGDWMLFLKQRLDSHAQLEIRVYAEAIATMIEELFPAAMSAFYDYQLHSEQFSRMELKVLKNLTLGTTREKVKELMDLEGLGKRERGEFLKKMDY
jgi:thymidylate synthase (FAD)